MNGIENSLTIIITFFLSLFLGFLNSMFAGMSEDKAGNLQMILPVILENVS